MRRYKIRCAVFLILTKVIDDEEYVLLQHRHNTKILNDVWDVSAGGHLEADETVREAIIRETKEEIGIDIDSNDLTFVNLVHERFSDTDYLLVVFSSNKWRGNEMIMESDKCDDLRWFKFNELPLDIGSNRKLMIEDYINNVSYRESGFKEVR